MTERSWPWPGVLVGDTGAYSDDEWDDMFEMRFGSGAAPYNDRGVIRNWANELEVTDPVVANRVDVDTGAALVHGKHYDNDALVNVVAIPNSVGAWREDLVCLQSDWVAQTTRIYRHENPADTVAYPAATQNDGVLWEIPLAAVRIDNGGVITLITDLRDYVSDLMQPKQLIIQPINDEIQWDVSVGTHCGIMRDNAGLVGWYEFGLPLDFKEFLDAYIVFMTSQAGRTVDWTLLVSGGGCGDAYNRWSDTATANAQAVPQSTVTCVDVSDAFDSGNLLPGDMIGCKLSWDVVSGTGIGAYLLYFRYR